jgi:DNA-binding response OmpR family regulator
MRLLIVEDNEELAELLAKGLRTAGYEADVLSTVEDARAVLSTTFYAALILDLGLPDGDGLALLRELRQRDNPIPVLVLTARGGLHDRVQGLRSGADDYLVKPFVEEELIARVGAILRRADRPLVGIVQTGALRIDLAGRNVTYADKPIVLGATEFRLLEFLARNVGIALSRNQIVERIWDYDFEGSSNIVDVYVSQLRRKLKALGASDVIETVWGIGYRLKSG